MQGGASAPFADNPGVIGAILFVVKAGEEFLRPRENSGQVFLELVGESQKQPHQRLSVGRLNLKDVEINAFCFSRLAEQPIPYRFLEGSRNPFF